MNAFFAAILPVLLKVLSKLAPVILHELYGIVVYVIAQAKERWLPAEIELSDKEVIKPDFKMQWATVWPAIKQAVKDVWVGMSTQEKSALGITPIVLTVLGYFFS